MNPYDLPDRFKIQHSNGMLVRVIRGYTLNQALRFAEHLATRNAPNVYVVYKWSYRFKKWHEVGEATAFRR